jgi:arylsulfatase A-like enzyme
MFDIMPTVFDAAALSPPYRFQGRSLLRVLEMSPVAAARHVRIAEQHEPGVPQKHDSVAVQDGAWKLMFRQKSNRRPRLFHLPTDPDERDDLSKEHPEMVRRLRDHYDRMQQENRELAAAFTFEEGNQARIDEELTDQLRALGYVD